MSSPLPNLSKNSPGEAGLTSEGLSSWLSNTTFPSAGTALACGVSGGADSLALLALGVAAGCDVTAIHVDHGQRPTSADEARVVEACAASLGASFESHRVEVEPGSNLEARMRAARYGVLGPDAATGHTADDQAETVLINLVRGSGLVGLGAMEPGFRRPILSLRRADTEAICATLGWTPVIDESNRDPAFLRNRMRHEVMPLLSSVADRDVVPLLTRSAAHARDAASALVGQASEVDPTNAKQLQSVAPAIAAIALQRWVREETGDDHPIDAASVQRVLDVVNGNAKAAEVSGGWRVSRSQQVLSISEPSSRESR